MPGEAKSRSNPDGLQGFLTKSGRKIHRQDVRGEILNRLLELLTDKTDAKWVATGCRWDALGKISC